MKSEPPKTDRDTAWDRALTARMNQYYHQSMRKRWARYDTSAVVACMSTTLAGYYLGSAALVAVSAAICLSSFRFRDRSSRHVALASRYLAHAVEFERMFNSSSFDGLGSELTRFHATEAVEAVVEGAPNHRELEKAMARVERSVGLTANPESSASSPDTQDPKPATGHSVRPAS